MEKLEITGIVGTTYLCSKFTNHDGTIVSDHPLYLFETNDKNIWVGVMFTTKTNPFTTKWQDGKDLQFTCCSDHNGELPTKKVFQAEVYIIDKTDKNFKYSEYTFKLFSYHQEILKAIRNALNQGINSNYKCGFVSVHDYNNTDNREDMGDIMHTLRDYVDNIIQKGLYARCCPNYGPVNTSYNDYNKWYNESNIKRENSKVFEQRKGYNF